MKVAILAGGTGGTKLAHGFAMLGDEIELELTAIANVGDDAEFHGLHVSPDIDALLYTLAGLINTDRGWGVRGETHTAHAMFERLGEESWFTVGDADLATHVHRTRLLREGASLTDATAAMATALGIRARILPATDDRLRTRLETDAGLLDFQDYFVRLRQEPEVRAIVLDGLATARPSQAVIDAIERAHVVVIGPSNPLVSIGPILELPGLREALAKTAAGDAAGRLVVAGAGIGRADGRM